MDKFLELFYKYKYRIIVGLLLLVLITVWLILHFNQDKEAVTKAEEVSVLEPKIEESIVGTEKIKINIKGAVVNSGVYELDNKSRVIDAINISGGLLDNADTSILNLSKKLKDEDVIIIYTNEEVKKIKEGNVVIQYIEKECNCPEINNSACIDPDSLINGDEEKNDNMSNNSSKISINMASLEELQTLTGIGKSKAEAIIEYRTTNGLFKTIEDIKNVSGIGDAAFEKIKDSITT